MKTALITGTTGQDGTYLAELLLEKDIVTRKLIRCWTPIALTFQVCLYSGN